MRRKDYELLAEAFRRALERQNMTYGAPEGTMDTARVLANMLHSANPRFEKDRWLKDAGVTP